MADDNVNSPAHYLKGKKVESYKALIQELGLRR